MSALTQIKKALTGHDYHWESTRRHSSCWIRVIDVTFDGDEFWVETVKVDINGVPKPNTNVKNDLSRFIEATTINSRTSE